MKSSSSALLGLATALFVAAGWHQGLAQAFDNGYSCTVCHSDKKAEFSTGVHITYGVRCETCHGGDPNIMDENAHSRASGFGGSLGDGRPPFSKKETVKVCGSCHSDAAEMLQYGIPSNQEALYRISQHGKALFERNDEDVAACIDCHGVHSILPPSDPRSTVYPRNIPATCARCHGDRKLMEKYGLSWDAYDLFVASVHGRALEEERESRAPNCAFCHGVHGATPPHVTEIENVCGQCHRRTRDSFNRSPHREAMAKHGMPECIGCHGNHGIAPASLDLFDTSCTSCHEPSSGAYRRGQELKALIVEAAGAVGDARLKAREAARSGVNVRRYLQALEEAETNLIQTGPVSHSLSAEEVEKLVRTSMAIADDVKLELFHQLEEIRTRRFVLVAVWGFILIMVPTMMIKRYRVARRLEVDK